MSSKLDFYLVRSLRRLLSPDDEFERNMLFKTATLRSSCHGAGGGRGHALGAPLPALSAPKRDDAVMYAGPRRVRYASVGMCLAFDENIWPLGICGLAAARCER
jgi:hypothetical protein